MATGNPYSASGVGQTNSDSDSYSYGSDSDAMSVRSGSGRGSQMDMDSARGCSPAPSIYSYHPSIDGNALREVHGRYFNSQNETYMLPADLEEHGRLGLQHDSLTMSIGSLYQFKSAVHEVLQPRPGYTPSIVDIGCGTGTWCIAMAKQFPHCEVVGIDLAPPQPGEPIPPNCRFEIDDANLGFPHFASSFDVVHTRCISAGIVNYPYFLRECSRMLRPGGVFLIVDGDLQLYDENFEGLTVCEEGEPGYSWLQRIFFASYNSMKNRGSQIDGMTLTPRWIREIPDFEEVGTQDIFIPVGSWLKGDSRVEVVSDLIKRDCELVIRGMKPMLMSEGYFGDTVDTFIEEALIELHELEVRIYSVWHFAWARKTLLPTLPDEKTIAERTEAPNRPQLTTAQILSPSGIEPGAAPIYPPAPAPTNDPVLPVPIVRPHVRNVPSPGGNRPIVPHAPSRYDNYQPPRDPFASLDMPNMILPTLQQAETGQPGLAALAQLQPELFQSYWTEAQVQHQVLQQQYEAQQAWMQQQRRAAEQEQYDAALAAHLQEQLTLQERRNAYPAFGEPGPSSRLNWG